MSDDIVKWLRFHIWTDEPTALDRAADEIERLRAENTELKNELAKWVHYWRDRDVHALRAELAACKEQLHLTNIDWFQAEAERDALLALLRSAVMQLPEHRRARFEEFLKDMGERPLGKTLERKDRNKDYSPENCCWATAKEQSVNRSTTAWFEIDGRRQHLADWCREYGVSGALIRWRMRHHGCSFEQALKAPKRRYGS